MMLILWNSVVGLPQASTFAADVDLLFDFVFWFSVVGLVGVTVAGLWFMWRYRRSHADPDKTAYIEGHTPSELGVSFFLFVVTMAIFYWGWIDYKTMLSAPPGAMEINVTGRQWAWQFEYPNGRKETTKLTLPKGVPVKLIMGSADVLHSFYVPALRVKQDLIPGAYTSLWFEATQTGEFPILCAEYCGTAHSLMLSTLKIVEADAYERWHKRWEFAQQFGVAEAQAAPLPAKGDAGVAAPDTPAAQPPASLAEKGKQLFAEKACMACHTVDGSALVGPSLKGMFGSKRLFADGSSVVADENYVRQSLMDPQAKVVKGFQPVMPTQRGLLTDEEINALVAYIKSVK